MESPKLFLEQLLFCGFSFEFEIKHHFQIQIIFRNQKRYELFLFAYIFLQWEQASFMKFVKHGKK